MGVDITYKGATIASMTDSGTKTLLTAGKYCEANIGIDYTASSSNITPQKDGLTRLYINIPDDVNTDDLVVPLYWNQSVSEGVEVDWGDGISAPFTVSGTGNVSAPTPHTYAPGRYIITMEQKNGSTIQLGNNSTGSGILGETGTSSNIYRSVLYGMETGNGVTKLQNYCCCRHTSLRTVIFGGALTAIGNYAFQYCYGLGALRFLGPSLPANADIGATNVWQNVPIWCKIWVPPAYINDQEQPQNIPARMPSTSTYKYVVEPNAYPAS